MSIQSDATLQTSPRTTSKSVPAQTVMRVGGEVTAPVMTQRVEIDFAKCTTQRVPIPFMVIEAIVDQTGKVRDARFLKPVPRCADNAVMQAIQKSTFKPGTYRGQPISVIFNITINIHYR